MSWWVSGKWVGEVDPPGTSSILNYPVVPPIGISIWELFQWCILKVLGVLKPLKILLQGLEDWSLWEVTICVNALEMGKDSRQMLLNRVPLKMGSEIQQQGGPKLPIAPPSPH